LSDRNMLSKEEDPLRQLQSVIDIFENSDNVLAENQLPEKVTRKIKTATLKKVFKTSDNIKVLEKAALSLLDIGGNLCPELTFLDEELKVEDMTALEFAAHLAWEVVDKLNYKALRLKFPNK
jgi:hypothetical protein